MGAGPVDVELARQAAAECAAASTALSPVLHWRALPAEEYYAFGTVEVAPEQYAEAEEAVRVLRDVLDRITWI